MINYGGVIYGLIKGLFIVTVAFAVLLIISPMIDEEHINTINESTIGSIFYNHNLLIGLIK